MAKQTVPPLPLPKNWPRRVRSAAVHAIALARLALTTAHRQAGTVIANPPGRPLPGQDSHLSNSNRSTIVWQKYRPWRLDSIELVSGIPGAIQFMEK